VRVEPMALGRLVRPVDPVPVELPWAHVGQVDVPDQVGAPLHGNPDRLARVVRSIEQAQLHRTRVFGEDREVDALAVPRRTLWVGSPGPDSEPAHAGPSTNRTAERGARQNGPGSGSATTVE